MTVKKIISLTDPYKTAIDSFSNPYQKTDNTRIDEIMEECLRRSGLCLFSPEVLFANKPLFSEIVRSVMKDSYPFDPRLPEIPDNLFFYYCEAIRNRTTTYESLTLAYPRPENTDTLIAEVLTISPPLMHIPKHQLQLLYHAAMAGIVQACPLKEESDFISAATEALNVNIPLDILEKGLCCRILNNDDHSVTLYWQNNQFTLNKPSHYRDTEFSNNNALPELPPETEDTQTEPSGSELLPLNRLISLMTLTGSSFQNNMIFVEKHLHTHVKTPEDAVWLSYTHPSWPVAGFSVIGNTLILYDQHNRVTKIAPLSPENKHINQKAAEEVITLLMQGNTRAALERFYNSFLYFRDIPQDHPLVVTMEQTALQKLNGLRLIEYEDLLDALLALSPGRLKYRLWQDHFNAVKMQTPTLIQGVFSLISHDHMAISAWYYCQYLLQNTFTYDASIHLDTLVKQLPLQYQHSHYLTEAIANWKTLTPAPYPADLLRELSVAPQRFSLNDRITVTRPYLSDPVIKKLLINALYEEALSNLVRLGCLSETLLTLCQTQLPSSVAIALINKLQENLCDNGAHPTTKKTINSTLYNGLSRILNPGAGEFEAYYLAKYALAAHNWQDAVAYFATCHHDLYYAAFFHHDLFFFYLDQNQLVMAKKQFRYLESLLNLFANTAIPGPLPVLPAEKFETLVKLQDSQKRREHNIDSSTALYFPLANMDLRNQSKSNIDLTITLLDTLINNGKDHLLQIKRDHTLAHLSALPPEDINTLIFGQTSVFPLASAMDTFLFKLFYTDISEAVMFLINQRNKLEELYALRNQCLQNGQERPVTIRLLNKHPKSSTNSMSTACDEEGNIYKFIQIHPHTLDSSLGSGTYKNVRIIIKNNIPYALSKLFRIHDDPEFLPEFLTQIRFINSFPQNLAVHRYEHLIAYPADGSYKLGALSRIAPFGSLSTFRVHSRIDTNQLQLVFMEKIGRTTAYFHYHGYSHNDIKPGNILVFASDQWELSDFDFFDKAFMQGTFPEPFPNATTGPAYDIWCLGLTFVYAFTTVCQDENQLVEWAKTDMGRWTLRKNVLAAYHGQEISLQVYQILEGCLRENPAERHLTINGIRILGVTH